MVWLLSLLLRFADGFVAAVAVIVVVERVGPVGVFELVSVRDCLGQQPLHVSVRYGCESMSDLL